MKAADSVNQFRVRQGKLASDDSLGMYGAFLVPYKGRCVLQCIASDGDESGWEHVSVVSKYQNQRGKWIERTPTWEEMCFIKDLFWSGDEAVVQFHPLRSEYVNNHAHCLHLWRPEGDTIPLPPSILVGIKTEDNKPLTPSECAAARETLLRLGNIPADQAA